MRKTVNILQTIIFGIGLVLALEVVFKQDNQIVKFGMSILIGLLTYAYIEVLVCSAIGDYDEMKSKVDVATGKVLDAQYQYIKNLEQRLDKLEKRGQ